MSSSLSLLLSLSLVTQAPSSVDPFAPAVQCKPTEVTCATGCFPIGTACPSALEIEGPPVPPPRPAPSPRYEGPRSIEEEEAFVLKPRRPSGEACLEPMWSFNKRRAITLLGFGVGFFVLEIAALAVVLTTREDRTSSPTFGQGPVCKIGKPCGDSCIDAAEECHVGRGSARYSTGTGSSVGAVVLALAGLGLLSGGLVYTLRMERRINPKCSFSGCSLTVRF